MPKQVAQMEGSKPDDYLLRKNDSSIYRASGRLPCEQPYQRMLVTYDGRVGMCCYDWGAKHPVGYVSSYAWEKGKKDLQKTMELAGSGTKSYERLNNIQYPVIYNGPEHHIEGLREIWEGAEISRVREAHARNCHEEIEICKCCLFKDTYQWEYVATIR